MPTKKLKAIILKNSDGVGPVIACMIFSGVWMPDGMNETWNFMFKAYAIIFQTFLYVFTVLAEIGYLIMVLGDTERTVDAAVLLMSHLVQGVKVLTIIVRQRRIKKLVQFIDGPNFYKPDSTKQPTLYRNICFISLMGRFVMASAGITAIFWCIVPMLGSKLTLPLRTAYPFDISNKATFIIMYVYNGLSVAVVGIGDAAENYLVAGLTVLAVAQLDLLCLNLTEAGKSASYNEIVKCIKFHQDIIKYVKELASIFGIALLFQFITTSITMCMTMFKIAITREPLEFVTLWFYFGCVFLELLMYCYPGELLINESLLVADAAYPDNFTGDSRGKRALLLTALRAQRALTLSAGGVFWVSMPTAAAVVQTAYSYYAVLKQKADV